MSDVHETLVRLKDEATAINRELQDLIKRGMVTTTDYIRWFDTTTYYLDGAARHLDRLIEANPPRPKAYRVRRLVSCVVEGEDARAACDTVTGRLKQAGFDVSGWDGSVEVVS